MYCLILFALCVSQIWIRCIFIMQCYASTVYAVILCLSMWCGCSVPAAEWLDSSAVIAQLAHAVASPFSAMRCGNAALPKWLRGGLVIIIITLSMSRLLPRAITTEDLSMLLVHEYNPEGSLLSQHWHRADDQDRWLETAAAGPDRWVFRPHHPAMSAVTQQPMGWVKILCHTQDKIGHFLDLSASQYLD